MSATKIVGIVLIVAGTLGLIYGSFSYTKEKHDVKLGPLQFSVTEKETVNVPVWAGAGAIAIGVVLILIGRKP
jgi:drug/metabolite transporter (DMT)-like permease